VEAEVEAATTLASRAVAVAAAVLGAAVEAQAPLAHQEDGLLGWCSYRARSSSQAARSFKREMQAAQDRAAKGAKVARVVRAVQEPSAQEEAKRVHAAETVHKEVREAVVVTVNLARV
jgi:hypothetical protein